MTERPSWPPFPPLRQPGVGVPPTASGSPVPCRVHEGRGPRWPAGGHGCGRSSPRSPVSRVPGFYRKA